MNRVADALVALGLWLMDVGLRLRRRPRAPTPYSDGALMIFLLQTTLIGALTGLLGGVLAGCITGCWHS